MMRDLLEMEVILVSGDPKYKEGKLLGKNMKALYIQTEDHPDCGEPQNGEARHQEEHRQQIIGLYDDLPNDLLMCIWCK